MYELNHQGMITAHILEVVLPCPCLDRQHLNILMKMSGKAVEICTIICEVAKSRYMLLGQTNISEVWGDGMGFGR